MTETPPPQVLRAIKQAGEFEIAWSQGTTFHLPFKVLRYECPCAQCVDEITGIRKLRPEDVRDDVHPVELSFSGNYALKVTWSDGHSTGLYTWDRLRRICELQAGR